jgi:hypothetical protein
VPLTAGPAVAESPSAGRGVRNRWRVRPSVRDQLAPIGLDGGGPVLHAVVGERRDLGVDAEAVLVDPGGESPGSTVGAGVRGGVLQLVTARRWSNDRVDCASPRWRDRRDLCATSSAGRRRRRIGERPRMHPGTKPGAVPPLPVSSGSWPSAPMGGDEPLAAVRISARPHRGDALGIDGPVYFSPDPEEPADAAGRNQPGHARRTPRWASSGDLRHLRGHRADPAVGHRQGDLGAAD